MANDAIRNAPGTSGAEIAHSQFATGVEDYGSFSGANIIAHINSVEIAQLMAVTYTVHTEKVANYTFGSANPRRFTTGKRGIAGTLIFNTFDRSALLSVFAGSNGTGQPLLSYVGNKNSNSSQFITEIGSTATTPVSTPWNPVGSAAYYSAPYGSNQFQSQLGNNIVAAYSNTFNVPLEYTDQLPPFDITLTMTDNLGKAAYMALIGVEIINEGGGFNIDDLNNQSAFTFVCRALRPLQPVSTGPQGVNINGLSSKAIPVAQATL